MPRWRSPIVPVGIAISSVSLSSCCGGAASPPSLSHLLNLFVFVLSRCFARRKMMSHFNSILILFVGEHIRWLAFVSRVLLPVVFTGKKPPAPPPTPSISGFFDNLYGQLTLFAGAMTVFFFALAGLFYGASILTSSERARSHAIASIYGALIGLALVLLAGTAAAIIRNAAQ